MIRHYLGREAPEDLEEFTEALAEVMLKREWIAQDMARGIAIAFAGAKDK